MSRVDLAIFQGSDRISAPTERASALEIATGPRGLESVTAAIPAGTYESFDLYRRLGQLTADVAAGGARIARGRVEDITIADDGAQVRALGPWRELADVPYTALWSASGVDGWFESSPVYDSALSNRVPELYEYEFSERIVLSLIKGTSYPASGARVGGVAFRIPNASARGIVGIQFRARVLLPSNWEFAVNSYADDAFNGGAMQLSTTAAGVLFDRAYHLTFTAAGAVEIYIFNNTGAASAPAGETGSWYAWLSDIRLVTSTAQRVNTTLTANRAAGVGVTATVGSTAGMYAGMQLGMNAIAGNTNSEIVTVTSVTNATQFVATFVNSYVIGNAVQGLKVRADEVAGALVSYVKGVNAGGVLSSSTALIQSCDRDLLNAAWEDVTPADIISELAERGDGAQRYEAGAFGDGLLYFRPAGSAGQSWFVDAADLSIQQTLDGLVNSVYARYQDASGRTLRTAAQANSVSAARYGLTRQGVVDADTTNATIAGQVASVAAANTADPVPRAGLTVTRIYTASGAEAPLWLARSGDTVTIRNLPPAVTAGVNRVQTFRLAETRYDAVAGALVLVPESPLPDLEHQQAAILRAAEVAASLSGTPAAAAITTLAPQQVRRSNPAG